MRIASLTIASAIVLAAATAHVADAAPPTITNRLWTSVGNGCVVADESNGIYDSRLAGLGFLSWSTGTIRAYCPVAISTNGSSPWVTGLGFSYKFPLGNTGTILARLWRVADGSNSASLLCTVNGSASFSGLAVDWCSVGSTLSRTHSYWVEIQMTRANTTVDVEALSVFLYN